MTRIRIRCDDLEWLHRKLASLAKDLEGTKEGQRWKRWHDWAWAELQARRGEPDEEAQGNGKGDGA